MGLFSSCCNSFATLSRGAAKATAARFRQMGLLNEDRHWATRAQICERCPLRTIRGKISYCGLPLMEKTQRDPVYDGCGCPVHAKARDPAEHCPLSGRHQPSVQHGGSCDCKWCHMSDQHPQNRAN